MNLKIKYISIALLIFSFGCNISEKTLLQSKVNNTKEMIKYYEDIFDKKSMNRTICPNINELDTMLFHKKFTKDPIPTYIDIGVKLQEKIYCSKEFIMNFHREEIQRIPKYDTIYTCHFEVVDNKSKISHFLAILLKFKNNYIKGQSEFQGLLMIECDLVTNAPYQPKNDRLRFGAYYLIPFEKSWNSLFDKSLAQSVY